MWPSTRDYKKCEKIKIDRQHVEGSLMIMILEVECECGGRGAGVKDKRSIPDTISLISGRISS